MTGSKPSEFNSSLAPFMDQFVREKRAVGYRYNSGVYLLMRLDRFLAREAPNDETLTRVAARKWLAKGSFESGASQQHRFTVVRQFALFLCRLGHPAYVPDRSLSAKREQTFSPRILTHAEVRLILREVDRLAPTAHSPLRHLVMPEIFRLLYGCGFRLSEVLKLRVADADLNRGVLTVRDGKFGKDRHVPPALPLVRRLQAYDVALGPRKASAFFFPSDRGGPWRGVTVYALFRRLLFRSGIQHGGPGKGPRVHDLRHTFAVHTMLRWYREGIDLDAKLPVLATYLGHESLKGTQRYLHMTAELHPEVVRRVNVDFGDVIPRRVNI